MSTPERARAASDHFGYAARSPIRRGAALPRPQRAAVEYDTEEYDEPPQRRYARPVEPEPPAQASTRGCVAYISELIGASLLVCLGAAIGYFMLVAPTPAQTRTDPLPTAAQAPTYAAPASDYGAGAYNATQEARGAALEAPQPTMPPPGDPAFAASFEEAECSAMLTYLPGHRCYVEPTTEPAVQVDTAYVVITATPEPTAFADTFQQPTCSAMITYLRGHPCYGRVNQAPQPQPGSDDFASSFKKPGE